METCPHCSGTGFVKEGNAVRLCECRFSEEDVNTALQIPRRFWEATLDNYLCESESEIEALKVARIFSACFDPEKGEGLTFIGPPGVGKTHLAVGVLKKIYTESGVKGIFFDTKDLIYRLKALIEEKKINRAIKSILNLPLILLDDLGSERLSDWQRELISYIISFRYNNMKSTIITTNYLLEAPTGEKEQSMIKVYLSQRLDPGTVSRIWEMTEVRYIKGRDRRKKVE